MIGRAVLSFGLGDEPIDRVASLGTLFVRADLSDSLEDIDLGALLGEARTVCTVQPIASAI